MSLWLVRIFQGNLSYLARWEDLVRREEKDPGRCTRGLSVEYLLIRGAREICQCLWLGSQKVKYSGLGRNVW